MANSWTNQRQRFILRQQWKTRFLCHSWDDTKQCQRGILGHSESFWGIQAAFVVSNSIGSLFSLWDQRTSLFWLGSSDQKKGFIALVRGSQIHIADWNWIQILLQILARFHRHSLRQILLILRHNQTEPHAWWQIWNRSFLIIFCKKYKIISSIEQRILCTNNSLKLPQMSN